MLRGISLSDNTVLSNQQFFYENRLLVSIIGRNYLAGFLLQNLWPVVMRNFYKVLYAD